MTEEALRRRRGPKPNPNRGTPSGYRLTDRTRFELQLAAAFVGTTSLQDTIALAVDEFLASMRQVDGYSEALRAAETSQQRRAGVPALPSSDPDDNSSES
ncbi:MAG: hypothetical protein GEU98_23770 [Pseudonocardiaceae bacterium]|nr:hypothetical protein [Pseudonocardiaceae bacterium]